MERLYSITKEELLKLYELSELNPLIKEDQEFEKWILELEKNIALGNNSNGTIFDKHYIQDEKVRIEKKEECLFINPSPFEKEKQKLSTIDKKAALLIINNRINVVVIKDMIIDNNFIFENLNARKIYFENCYFTDNFVFNLGYVNELEFLYCNISNFHIFSNTNASKIKVERSKFRSESTKFNKIISKKITLKSTNLNYKYLFFTSSFENLEYLKITNKVFNDSDIIMLDQIAPVLEKARLNIVLNDLNTFEKINPMVYFTYPFEIEEKKYRTDYEFVSNSEIYYKLTDKNERKKIIENIEEAIDSVYKNKEYKSLKSRIVFNTEIYNNIEKYNLDKNKTEFLKNTFLSLNNLEENIKLENIDEDTKNLILLEIKDLKNNLNRLDRHFDYGNISGISLDFDLIFKPLYSNYNDLKFYAKTEDYRSYALDGSVRDPKFIESSVEKMIEVLKKYKNNRIKKFDFFEILSITEMNLSFMYIFKQKRNFTFYKNISLNKKNITKINESIQSESLSYCELIKKIDLEESINNLGILLPTDKNFIFKDRINYEKIKISLEDVYGYELRQVMKYLTETEVTKTKHEKMISSCSLYKYYEVKEKLKKYKKNNRLKKFIEIYGDNEEYNIEDYELYLNNHKIYNDTQIFMQICLNILYENKEKLFNLTSKDYDKIKSFINDNYSKKYYGMNLYYYYELINYITEKYPDFINRHINTFHAEEKKDKRVFLLNHCYETRKEIIKKLVIEEFNKSRIDREEKQKILIKEK